MIVAYGNQNGITLYTALFDKANKELMTELGISYHDIFKDQMRMLVETLMKWTPPNNKSQGTSSINKSLDTMFFGVSDDETLFAMHGIASSRGTFKGHTPDRILIGTNTSEMRSLHNSMRTKRGIVRRNPTHYFVRDDMLNKYKAETKKRSGRLKQGWINALSKLGSKKFPSWITKAQSSGSVFGATSGNADVPPAITKLQKLTMSAWNDTPYIRDIDGMVNRAEKVRLIDIKKRLSTRMEQLAKRKSAA